MLILGCDLSSRYLAFVASDDLMKTMMMEKYDIRTGPRDKFSPEVCANAMDATLAFVEAVRTPDRYAFVEEPVVARGGIKTTMVQSFINGTVQAVLIKAGFSVELVPNTKWKQVVCGSGRIDKAGIGQVISARWTKAHRAADGDQDLYDAAGLCLYGQEKKRIAKSIIKSGTSIFD